MIQTNDGRVHLFDPAHVNSSPPGLTDAVAAEWATASDLITVNGSVGKPPSKLQGHETAMSGLTSLGIYTKAGHEYDKTLPEAMYSHKFDGSRRVDATWNVYLMQQDSAWRKKHQDDLLALKAANPWSSLFIADSAAATYHQGGRPYKPGTTIAYSEWEWYALVKASLDQWRTSVAYPLDSLNGLHSYTVDQFSPTIGMMEACFRSLSGSLPTEAQWLSDAQLAWDAQGKGWQPWLFVKMKVLYTDPLWAAFRRLMAPTALLLDRGSLGYVQTSKEQMDPSWVTGEYKQACYRPGIGLPFSTVTALSNYQQQNGAYLKHYAAGAVIVNPTSSGVSVTLDDGSAHPVDPQSGVILRQTVSWEVVG